MVTNTGGAPGTTMVVIVADGSVIEVTAMVAAATSEESIGEVTADVVAIRIAKNLNQCHITQDLNIT